MSNLILLRPLTPSVFAFSSGTLGDNVRTPDPKEAWASTAAGTGCNFDFDFGANVSIDSAFIGFIGGASTPAVTWTSGAGAYTTVTNQNNVTAFAPTSSASPLRRHGFWRLGAPVNHRYHRLNFSPNVVATVTIGIIIFGLALETTYNREWGSGRTVIDTGAKERLLGGGFGIGGGARKVGFRWTWGDLTDAEVEALLDLALNVGETDPILICEDAAATTGLNERLHYGLFDRFEPYERQNPNLTRWSLSLEQWV